MIEESLEFSTMQVNTLRAIDDMMNDKTSSVLDSVTHDMIHYLALQTLTEERAVPQLNGDLL